MKRNTILWGALASLVLLGAGAYWLRPAPAPKPDPIGVWMAQITPHRDYYRHKHLTFQPRYRRDECLIRFDYQKEVAPGLSPAWIFREESFQFVMNVVPEVMDLRVTKGAGDEASGHLYARFADQCPRRLEIAREMAAWISKRHPGFRLTVGEEPPAGLEHAALNGPFWIDDPTYDSRSWQVARAAYNDDGSGAGYWANAQWWRDEKSPMNAYIWAVLAAERLASTAQKDAATQLRKKSWGEMSPPRREKALVGLTKLRALLPFLHGKES